MYVYINIYAAFLCDCASLKMP